MRPLPSAAVLGLIMLSACLPSPGPFRLPEVRGRVVDLDTQQPLAGAEVIEWYRGAGRSDARPPVYAARWATTDAEGRFELVAALSSSARMWFLKTYGPSYSIFHPRYGLQHSGTREDDGVLLQASRGRAEQALADLRPYCRGELADAGARRIAEIACAPLPERP